MKIRIPAETVNIDEHWWAIEYGIDPKDVRQDVKKYFAGWCQGQVDRLGLAPDDHCQITKSNKI